jgi:hypothetical protein
VDIIERLAGARDFRDFFCLPPVKENRTQPVDLAPAVSYLDPNFNVKEFEVSYVDRRKQAKRNEASS